MLFFSTLPTLLSTLLLITSSTAAPTSHKSTLEDVTPTTHTITARQSIGEINDILELADTVLNDILDLITDIDTAQHDIESQFTNNMVDALYAVAPTANIMVCHDCSFSLDAGAYFTHYELDISLGLGFTQGYDIAVFDDGQVQLNGDGGFINWCYAGDSSSDGGLVTFNQVAEDGY
jgi:hypothetical protein